MRMPSDNFVVYALDNRVYCEVTIFICNLRVQNDLQQKVSELLLLDAGHALTFRRWNVEAPRVDDNVRGFERNVRVDWFGCGGEAGRDRCGA